MRIMSASPQERRLARLKCEGITQRNVLVHESNLESFKILRPAFGQPEMAEKLRHFAASIEKSKPTNVSQVRQLSPFRYPGGKTWLIPVVREWMKAIVPKPKLLLEPFAGGAIVGLTAASEGWADHVRLVEIDDEVAAVWELTIQGRDSEFEKFLRGISDFDFTTENARTLIEAKPRALYQRALRTIVKNRGQRGGIMAPGAGLMKSGENGKGVASRWYPTTLVKRLKAIRLIRDRLTFVQADAFDEISQHSDPTTAQFIDPPYTAGGKKAGNRLYTHNAIDHDLLFKQVSELEGSALLTYDDNKWVRENVDRYRFTMATSVMQSTHLVKMHELVILKR